MNKTAELKVGVNSSYPGLTAPKSELGELGTKDGIFRKTGCVIGKKISESQTRSWGQSAVTIANPDPTPFVVRFAVSLRDKSPATLPYKMACAPRAHAQKLPHQHAQHTHARTCARAYIHARTPHTATVCSGPTAARWTCWTGGQASGRCRAVGGGAGPAGASAPPRSAWSC